MPKKGTAEHAEVTKIMDKLRSKKAEPEAKTVKAKVEKAKVEKAKAEPKRRKVKAESESDSDVPVAKPKARAEASEPKAKPEPKAKVKKGTVVSKDKFVPQLRTGQEKQDYEEKRELELMTEDFKAGSPLKKKTSVKK